MLYIDVGDHRSSRAMMRERMSVLQVRTRSTSRVIHHCVTVAEDKPKTIGSVLGRSVVDINAWFYGHGDFISISQIKSFLLDNPAYGTKQQREIIKWFETNQVDYGIFLMEGPAPARTTDDGTIREHYLVYLIMSQEDAAWLMLNFG